MATWPERACTALTVYYERGLRALDFINRGLWDDAELVLNMRKAAFHNFRSADFLALKEGYTPEQDAQLKAIWGQITSMDGELMAAMVAARDKMEVDMIRLGKVRATLGRFKSGIVVESKLEKPV